jgi:release factor glutamine methyltransferase
VTERWTISRVLSWMTEDFRRRSIESARLDAELLVAHALAIDRVGIYLDLERPLAPQELEVIRGLVRRRQTHEPIAYILGERAFRRHVFRVTPDVLVPRPDTELLVDVALGVLRGREGARLLDLCTGSGCVALSIASEGPPDLDVTGTDLSEAALRIARENESRVAPARGIRWLAGDLFEAIGDADCFDVIVANPPYVAESDFPSLAPDVRDHEPSLALRAGPTGLDCLRRIVSAAPPYLRAGGTLLLEHGVDQGADVARAMTESGFTTVASHRDLGGIVRVAVGRLDPK